MVRVPVREVVLLLAVTEYPTLPLPDPLPPELTVIQPALLVAVQVQPEGALTLTEPEPAAAPKELLVGEIEYVQACAA